MTKVMAVSFGTPLPLTQPRPFSAQSLAGPEVVSALIASQAAAIRGPVMSQGRRIATGPGRTEQP